MSVRVAWSVWKDHALLLFLYILLWIYIFKTETLLIIIPYLQIYVICNSGSSFFSSLLKRLTWLNERENFANSTHSTIIYIKAKRKIQIWIIYEKHRKNENKCIKKDNKINLWQQKNKIQIYILINSYNIRSIKNTYRDIVHKHICTCIYDLWVLWNTNMFEKRGLFVQLFQIVGLCR